MSLANRIKKSHNPLARLALVALAGLLVFSGATQLLVKQSDAAPAGWSAGRIIDDSVFTAKGSMSASQIQSFLNAKVPSCDTNGQQISEFGGPDLNKDGKVQRWEWGKSKYNQSTFPCLKDYSQGGKKASQIIYDVAQKYSISPKVLIVLLQKEQSLVTDTWPLNIQYRSATGYGCPDTAACDSQYYGLTNQIDWAAKMFHAIMDNSPTWYTPYELGNNYIQYNPSSSCGGSTVNIQNRATQALYNYTPYQPNKAALDAGWGSASCGAYGNRNFFLYYSGWFGQPNANATYGFSLVSRGVYSDASYNNLMASSVTDIKPGQTLFIKVVVRNTGNQVWYSDFLRLGTSSPYDRTSVFKNNNWLSSGRPSASEESTVEPGKTATFLFPITAPASFGSRLENFSLVLEGQRWISGTIGFIFNVADPSPVYAASLENLSIYKNSARTLPKPTDISTYPGSKFYITMKIKNTGNRDLPAGTTKLATTEPRNRISPFYDSSWAASNRPAVSESTLPPGKTATYNFSMTTPNNQIGTISEQIGMVIEGDRWISDNLTVLNGNIAERPPVQLTPGLSLQQGNSLLSSDERFRLVLQGDGNLVLYGSNGKALWSTRTAGAQ